MLAGIHGNSELSFALLEIVSFLVAAGFHATVADLASIAVDEAFIPIKPGCCCCSAQARSQRCRQQGGPAQMRHQLQCGSAFHRRSLMRSSGTTACPWPTSAFRNPSLCVFSWWNWPAVLINSSIRTEAGHGKPLCLVAKGP